MLQSIFELSDSLLNRVSIKDHPEIKLPKDYWKRTEDEYSPPLKKDISNPTEWRLGLLDELVKSHPEINEMLVEHWTACLEKINESGEETDEDGFQPESTD